MKRIPLVLTVFFIAVIGIYFLWKINNPPVIKPWDLVSSEALLVYQYKKNSTQDPTGLLIKSFIPDSIRKNLLEANELLISTHIVSKEEIGIILYASTSPQLESKISSALKSHRAYRERIFEGFKIIEASVAGKKVVAATTIDQILVLSSASLLIEDVIRLAKSKEKQNFIQDNKALFQFAQMKSDSGIVYLNFSKLSKVLNLFLSGNNQHPVVEHFAQSGVIESKTQKQDLLLNGFAVDSLSKGGSVLSLFNRQRPVPITLQQIISNRTGALVHFGITDFVAWNQDRLGYCSANYPRVGDSLKALNSNHGFDTDKFYQALGDEIGVCQAGFFSENVFIVELKNGPQALSELKKLYREKESPSSIENYAHYQIHSLTVPTMPITLFWPLINKEMRYYLSTDHHLIFSENLDDLKAFVSDIDSENTWGKSSEWNVFLSTSQDTNVGIIFDALNWWPSLRNDLTVKWQEFGDSTHLVNLNKGSFQFSRLEKSYYFNGILRFNQKRAATAGKSKEKFLEISLPQKINSPLTVVQNHNTRSSELLVQDENDDLKLFSSRLKNLFSVKISGKIKSEIHQIDFYKNKKLQYVFATERSIYLIDRLGNSVKGFPILISGSNPIQFLTVIDYDNSKNYRFLISDTKGKLILVDRTGKILPDWKPGLIQGDLRVAPQAVKASGKDCVIAVTVDGIVYCLNRNGESMSGFPVNLKLRPAGNWVLAKTDDQEVITVVSEEGVLVQIDLKGKIISKNNLIKSSSVSRFSLVAAPERDRYVISRIDQGKMAILNSKGEVIFEKENPGSNELFLTYFEASRGRRRFAFTDPQQEFTYFFDEKGKSVFARPLENQGTPAIITEKSGEIYFYCLNGNKIRSYSPKAK